MNVFKRLTLNIGLKKKNKAIEEKLLKLRSEVYEAIASSPRKKLSMKSIDEHIREFKDTQN